MLFKKHVAFATYLWYHHLIKKASSRRKNEKKDFSRTVINKFYHNEYRSCISIHTSGSPKRFNR